MASEEESRNAALRVDPCRDCPPSGILAQSLDQGRERGMVSFPGSVGPTAVSRWLLADLQGRGLELIRRVEKGYIDRALRMMLAGKIGPPVYFRAKRGWAWRRGYLDALEDVRSGRISVEGDPDPSRGGP